MIIYSYKTKDYSCGIIDNFSKGLVDLVFNQSVITKFFLRGITKKEKIKEIEEMAKTFPKITINNLFRKMMVLEKSHLETEEVWLL